MIFLLLKGDIFKTSNSELYRTGLRKAHTEFCLLISSLENKHAEQLYFSQWFCGSADDV